MRSSRSSFVLLALLSACTPSPSGDNAAAPAAPPSGLVIGKIDALEGDAFAWFQGQRVAARVGDELRTGDRLETGPEGKIKATLTDASVLAIGAGTQLELSDLTVDGVTRTGRVKVAAGKFWVKVARWTGSGASRYEVETPNAVAGVRGTTLWGDSKVDAICALEGTIEVSSLKDPTATPVTLEAGKCASELSHGKLAPFAPTPEQIDGFLDEVLIRRPSP